MTRKLSEVLHDMEGKLTALWDSLTQSRAGNTSFARESVLELRALTAEARKIDAPPAELPKFTPVKIDAPPPPKAKESK